MEPRSGLRGWLPEKARLTERSGFGGTGGNHPIRPRRCQPVLIKCCSCCSPSVGALRLCLCARAALAARSCYSRYALALLLLRARFALFARSLRSLCALAQSFSCARALLSLAPLKLRASVTRPANAGVGPFGVYATTFSHSSAPEPSRAVPPSRSWAHRRRGHRPRRRSSPSSAPKFLAVVRADVPRRRCDWRSILDKVGEVAGDL